jgi:hypothetical protein
MDACHQTLRGFQLAGDSRSNWARWPSSPVKLAAHGLMGSPTFCSFLPARITASRQVASLFASWKKIQLDARGARTRKPSECHNEPHEAVLEAQQVGERGRTHLRSTSLRPNLQGSRTRDTKECTVPRRPRVTATTQRALRWGRAPFGKYRTASVECSLTEAASTIKPCYSPQVARRTAVRTGDY